ncbi:NfeD family protein [Sunxiuqinia sp. A32]|uniref:NfeD family protein n=1 Tax=Sunxiuqinia sp. A32 TaxID=3461496 RepID=UPI004046738D
MTFLIILFLIFLGILLLLLEFAVIPGITIAGIGGVVLFGISIYLAFDTYGTIPGILTLAFIIIVSPLLIYRFFKGRTGKKMVLESEITGKVIEVDGTLIHEGDEGVTVGRLAPMGKVRVNGEIIEAKSISGFVDPNVKIKVIEVIKTHVIIEPINQ